MTDIILLQTRFGFYDAMGARVPTGLLSIAAVPCHLGLDVVLIDQRVQFDWQDRVREHIRRGAKVVCLTAIVGEQIRFMMEASRFVKSVNPDVLVFLGGSWAQTEPEMCLQDSNVDMVCYGEGDYLLPDILSYCYGRKRIEEIRGIVYRAKDGSIRKNAPRPLIKDLDDLPPVPYHLVDLKDYTGIGLRPGRSSIALMVSRDAGSGAPSAPSSNSTAGPGGPIQSSA